MNSATAMEPGVVMRHVVLNSKGKVASSRRVMICDVDAESGKCEVVPFDDDSNQEIMIPFSELRPIADFEKNFISHSKKRAPKQITVSLLDGKEIANSVFALKDYVAASVIYSSLLNRILKDIKATDSIKTGKKAVRAVVISSYVDQNRAMLKVASVKTGTASRVPRKQIMYCISSDPELAAMQVTLHLNLARCLLEIKNMIKLNGIAFWPWFCILTMSPRNGTLLRWRRRHHCQFLAQLVLAQ